MGIRRSDRFPSSRRGPFHNLNGLIAIKAQSYQCWQRPSWARLGLCRRWPILARKLPYPIQIIVAITHYI